MSESDISFDDLSAVAVSRGPGSYTGLRIGVSTAKGICYACDIPLIAIDTLKTMAIKVIRSQYNELDDLKDIDQDNRLNSIPEKNIKELLQNPGAGNLLLCPMIDARRMEVYMALFDSEANRTRDITAEIITETTFSQFPEEKMILFFGDGADKCRQVIVQKNVIFIPGIYPSAEQMAELSCKSLMESRFEDTAYFEPFYLKDFITTTPKKKMV